MAETVQRVRHIEAGETDRFHKPIRTRQVTEHPGARFAPSSPGEDLTSDASTATAGGVLYFRSPTPPNSLPDDIWIVRGVEYQARGHDQLWRNRRGVVKGAAITITREEYTNG